MSLSIERIEEMRKYAKPEEILDLIAAARALARLEKWLRSEDCCNLWLRAIADSHGGIYVELYRWGEQETDMEGDNIVTAINDALDKAEKETAQ